MIDYIDAPMPFIMGVPRYMWKDIKRQRESIPSDVIVFDIDKNKLTCNERLPDLPPKAAESVYATMLSIMDEKERIIKTYKVPADRERRLAEFWVHATLRLKQSFLNMFFCLINNYLICYKEVQEQDDTPLIANEIFDFKKYLSFFEEQRQQFMAELCKTQGFHNFIEKSYKAKEEKNDMLFFAEGVKLCSEKGDKALAMRVKKITEQLLEKNRNPVSFSLDECYRIYQNKVSAMAGLTKTPQPGQLIDKLRVIPMQKINYFQYKSHDMNGYIFSKRNPTPVPLLRSDTEANIMTSTIDCTEQSQSKKVWERYNSTQVCLQSTLKLPSPCQLPLGEPNDTDNEIFLGEDCSIAEEFNENEEHISVDLARREVEKTYKFPKLSNTPRPKAPIKGLSFLFDRKRSITYMSTISTRGLFFRGKSIAKNLVTEKPVAKVVPVKQVMKERVNMVVPLMPQKPSFERIRTNSIDSCVNGMASKLGQKENMGITRNPHATPKNAAKGPVKPMRTIQVRQKLEKELKEKFSALLHKGPHKFSNTAQAQPKILVKKENSVELTGECSEVLGDELSTIRTNRARQATYRKIGQV